MQRERNTGEKTAKGKDDYRKQQKTAGKIKSRQKKRDTLEEKKEKKGNRLNKRNQKKTS